MIIFLKIEIGLFILWKTKGLKAVGTGMYMSLYWPRNEINNEINLVQI